MDFNKGVYLGNSEGYGWLAKLPKKVDSPVDRRRHHRSRSLPRLAWLCAFGIPLPLSRTGMMIFKGVMCAVAGCVSGYAVIGATTTVDAEVVRLPRFSSNQTVCFRASSAEQEVGRFLT